ncbi:MAG: pimeloyl-ACP methyl ester esterase BioH [Gammaproteobacteria bacterium]
MSLKLHTHSTGRGPDIYLMHGWCLHSGIWDSILPELTQRYRVTRVDLPGHGRSREVSMPATLPELAQLLLEGAPQNAVWLGWSLGGLACMRAAMDYPGRVRALVLVSSTPRFITAIDWPHAMPLERLQEMLTELQHDYRKTVQRFLALQVRGDCAARTALRQLRKELFASGEPSVASLQKGLVMLRDSDVRAELIQIHLPVLIMMGEYDRLTPPPAGQFMATAVHGAQYIVIPKAAHAPFLSSPAKFMAALLKFLQTLPAITPTQNSDHPYVSAHDARQS